MSPSATAQASPLAPSPMTANDGARRALDALAKARDAQAEAAVSIRKSFAAARKEAAGAARTRVRETVERLRKELQLIKKLWAGDPKELARQIQRIAKELKQALGDYARAAKDSIDAAPPMSAAVDLAAPTAEASETPPAEASAEADETAAGDPPADAAQPPEPNLAEALAAYGRAATDETAVQDRKEAVMTARGDLDFTREVRAFVRDLREVLQASHVRHAFNRKDPEAKRKAEEDAAKALTEVDKLDERLERDLRAAFPELALPRAA